MKLWLANYYEYYGVKIIMKLWLAKTIMNIIVDKTIIKLWMTKPS